VSLYQDWFLATKVFHNPHSLLRARILQSFRERFPTDPFHQNVDVVQCILAELRYIPGLQAVLGPGSCGPSSLHTVVQPRAEVA
jgi:hypothetical protein